MADFSGDKKHAPTQRKRQRARADGHVARSQDLTSAVLLLSALTSLWFLGGHAAEHLAAAISEGLSQAEIGGFGTQDASHLMMLGGARVAVAVAPVLIAILITGVLINVTQTGFLLVPSKIAPSLKNIDPINGAQRITSNAGFARLGFGLVKIGAVISMGYVAIRHYGDRVINLGGLEVPQIARTLFDCLIGTCVWIAIALFALALLDYGFQRWKYERNLMMTDEELREEMKETEMDPMIAEKRKQSQRGTTGRRSETQITTADVVVTGPSGVAVALQYNPMTMAAPIVVAKGMGMSAKSIEQIALRNGILVVERPLLAKHQFLTLNVGSEISADQYQAVAEVLRMLSNNQHQNVA